MYHNNNNVNNNNRQLNPEQYKNFKSGQFQNRNKPYENRYLHNNNKTQQNSTYTEIICNYFEKPRNLVRDCKIRPNYHLQTLNQQNSKALPSMGALRKS